MARFTRKINPYMKAAVTVLIVVVLLLPASLFGWPSGFLSSSVPPEVTKGKLDLSQWEFDQNGLVPLKGQWEYYDQQWYVNGIHKEGHSSTIEVPSVWKAATDGNGSKYGYGSYRMQVQLHPRDVDRMLGLYLPGIGSAYRLWVDGDLLSMEGVVGENEKQMKPKNSPGIALFYISDANIEIVVEVSNFVQEKGGIWNPILLADGDQISTFRDRRVSFEMLLVGGLLIMGIYHLFLYMHIQKNKAPLYFGLFCLVFALRSMLLGEIVINQIVPDLSWSILWKLKYITAYAAAALFIAYIRTTYPRELNRWIVRVYSLIGIGSSIFVVSTRPIIFTNLSILLKVYVMGAFIILISAILMAVKRRRLGSTYNLIAIIVLFSVVINDILYDVDLFTSINMMQLGLFVMLLTQAHIMAERYSKNINEVELINHKLEEKVQERTVELEHSFQKLIELNQWLSRLSYMDELTQIPNRRYFERYLNSYIEIQPDQRGAFSLMMIDIDYFKQYNDHYGHSEGDQCLKEIAKTLNETVENVSGIVARYGGEEFIAAFPDVELTEAKTIAEELRKNIEKLKIAHVGSKDAEVVTISIGVSGKSANQFMPFKILLHEADKALYKAKNEGKNRVQVVDEAG